MYFSGHAVAGFTTVILLLLLVGSILMFSLGVIGYYIAKIYDEVKMDYFAVSYPDLLIFDENFTRKNKAHCCYLMGLGNLGLGNLGKAKEHFEETLQLDPHHLLARLYLRGIQ